LLRDGLPPLLLAGGRFLLAAPLALLLMVVFFRASLRDFLPSHLVMRDYAVIGVIGLLQTTGAIGLLYVAMCRIPATNGAVLMFTTPIWIVTERLVLHQVVQPGRILGLVLRVAGIALAIQAARDGPFSSKALLGDVLVLAAASCWAAATIV